MIKKIALILYYGLASHLPSSSSLLGSIFKAFRAYLCKIIFNDTGKNINIEKNVFFGSGKDISIGDESGIGINARVQGPLTIGKYVMMGPDVLIYTRNHKIERTDIPMMYQGDTRARKVIIGNDVWIGARAIIMPGVTINDGAVVGAGALVSRDVPAYTIVAGVPARVIKKRK